MKKEKYKKCQICKKRTKHTNDLGCNLFLHSLISVIFWPWFLISVLLLSIENQNWKCDECKKIIHS